MSNEQLNCGFQAKIIFVIRYFHPFIGGLEKKVLNLASHLIHKGFSVEVVTSRFYHDWLANEFVKNVPVTRLPSPRIKIFGAAVFLFYLLKYLSKNRHRYSIIHTFQVGYCSAFAISIGNLLRKKTVLNLSGSGHSGDIKRNSRTPWGIIFLLLCRRAKQIVALNREMIKELHTVFYKDNFITLIPNGVNVWAYQKNYQRSTLRKKLGIGAEKIILYTGRLAQEKGVDFLVRAYATVAPSFLTRLYILGDGPERKKLKALIEQLQISDRVVMLPAVEEVLSFLQIADIFVMPSHSEGISNSILEAMACGVPVIATGTPGNVDLIEDGVTGLLVPPGDITEMSAALTTLLTNSEKAQNLSRQAHNMVQHNYDIGIMVNRYIALYKSLL